MRKTQNLKKMYQTDGYFDCADPYVSCLFESKPLRVTLDGEFGIDDLEYIIDKMKRFGTNDEKNKT